MLLQGKLLIDGFRDLVLVPISLVAALATLIRGLDRPVNEFYEVVRLGRKSERWINLFGAADRIEDSRDLDRKESPNVDALVEHFERLLREEYETGELTRTAKLQLDRAIEGVKRVRSRGVWDGVIPPDDGEEVETRREDEGPGEPKDR